jgi:hypothetical protein
MDLAAAWNRERDARAARAQQAVADGRATQAQADRDAHLCAIIADEFIGRDFPFPDARYLTDEQLNTRFDAADLAIDIARRARTGDADHWLALARIARQTANQCELVRAYCWLGFQLDQQNGRAQFEPGIPPPRWRIPT